MTPGEEWRVLERRGSLGGGRKGLLWQGVARMISWSAKTKRIVPFFYIEKIPEVFAVVCVES